MADVNRVVFHVRLWWITHDVPLMAWVSSWNVSLIGCMVSEISQFYILAFWLESAYARPFWMGFGGTFPPNNVAHHPSPKKNRPWAKPRHLSHKAWVLPRGSSWGLEKEKRTGQEKVTKGLYFTYFGRSTHWSDLHKNCIVGNFLDVITCAKFQNEIFRGYHFTMGRIFHLVLIFEWAIMRCLWFTAESFVPSFVRYCGHGSSLLRTPARRPSRGPMRLPRREEGNWLVCTSVCVTCRVWRVM